MRLLLLRHKLFDSVWMIMLDNSSTWRLQTTTLLEVMPANTSWALFAHGLQSYLLSGFVLLGRQQIRQSKCEYVCVHADDDPGPRGCWGTRPHPDNREQCCQISCDIIPGSQPAIRLSTLPKTALKTFWKHRYPINTMTCFRVQGWELFLTIRVSLFYKRSSFLWKPIHEYQVKRCSFPNLLPYSFYSKSYFYSPVLFMPWKPIGVFYRARRRWEVRRVGYFPAPWVGAVVMRGSTVPSYCVPRAVAVSPSILECPLRFGRSLRVTWRVPAFLPEQSVPLKLTPETPWSVEISGRHVVFLVVSWWR